MGKRQWEKLGGTSVVIFQSMKSIPRPKDGGQDAHLNISGATNPMVSTSLIS